MNKKREPHPGVVTAENLRKGGEEDLAVYRYRLARGETYDGKTSANSVSH